MASALDGLVFLKAFGDNARNRVLMFLLDNHEFDYSKFDIASNCSISRVTLDGFFGDFIRLGIVSKTRNVGRATLYKINFSSPVVKEIAKLNEIVTSEFPKRMTAKRKIPA